MFTNCQIEDCIEKLEKEIPGICDEAEQTESSPIKNEHYLAKLKLRLCRFENLFICSGLYKNNILKISHF